MRMTKEQIKSAALELDPAERESLAEEILQSINDTDRDAIDAAWLAEARRREAKYRSDPTFGRPVEEVLERLRKKAAS